MVEMAIVAPVAISLMVGVVDFGMAFSAQTTLGKSVRDAARYLAGLPTSAYCQSWAVAYAKSLVTNLLPSATVNVDCATSVIKVTATLSYNTIIPFPAFPSAFSLAAQHQEVQVGG
jgi:Flp pilus assembly protein TadG